MKSKKTPYWKHRLHEIVYEADTPAGKRFDLILLILILLSVVLVMLESIASIHTQYETELNIMEWVITGLFSLNTSSVLLPLKNLLAMCLAFTESSIYCRLFPNTYPSFLSDPNR